MTHQESNPKTIVDVLFDEMRLLYKECSELRDYMKSLTVPTNEVNSLEKKRSELEDCMNLIRIHQELRNTTLQEVDFYSKFKQHFYKDKANKEARFVVANDFKDEEVLEGTELLNQYLIEENKDVIKKTDKDIENDLKKQFTIKNCLPVMELVPIQFASNARKYMPPGTIVTVTLTQKGERNFITVSNLGPRMELDEKSRLIDEGGRGKNTSMVRGMGLGFKQVKEILKMHKAWLDTAFEVEQSESDFLYEKSPYSMFNVKFTYLNGENEQSINTDYLQWNEEFWSDDMPIVIVHNMFTITYDLRKLCEDKLKSLRPADANDKDEWKLQIDELLMVIRRFDDTLRQCLYYLDRDKDELGDAIMGNPCQVNLYKVVDRSFKTLVETFYSHKNFQYDVQAHDFLKVVDAHSSFYSFVCGVFSLIFDRAPKNSFFELTYEGGRKNNQIIISCEQCDFKEIFNENKTEIIENRVSMYQDMIGEWDGCFIVQDHTLKMLF